MDYMVLCHGHFCYHGITSYCLMTYFDVLSLNPFRTPKVISFLEGSQGSVGALCFRCCSRHTDTAVNQVCKQCQSLLTDLILICSLVVFRFLLWICMLQKCKPSLVIKHDHLIATSFLLFRLLDARSSLLRPPGRSRQDTELWESM